MYCTRRYRNSLNAGLLTHDDRCFNLDCTLLSTDRPLLECHNSSSLEKTKKRYLRITIYELGGQSPKRGQNCTTHIYGEAEFWSRSFRVWTPGESDLVAEWPTMSRPTESRGRPLTVGGNTCGGRVQRAEGLFFNFQNANKTQEKQTAFSASPNLNDRGNR
jgi:hypothetical protein